MKTLSAGYSIPTVTPEHVSVVGFESFAAIANTAVAVKSRMHEIIDFRERFPGLPQQDDVFEVYRSALDSLNAALPENLRQIWVRS